jgi:HSP20 family protein
MSRYFWDFDPFYEFNALQRQLEPGFTAPALTGKRSSEGTELSTWKPRVDVKETDKDFVLHMDAPGVQEKDIKVNIEDGMLTVSGQRESTKKDENERYHRVERSMGSFSRSMALPEGVEPNLVTASFENGVLEVRVPKPEARLPQSRKISVNISAPKQITGTSSKEAKA